VTIIENMQEINFGDWEDKSADEVKDKQRLNRFFDNPCDFQAPNGEAFEVFSKRVIEAGEKWLCIDSGTHRILLAHGCVIRVLLAHLLGMPSTHFWNLVIDTAGWSRVSWLAGEKPRVMFINRDAGDICKA
ncbi:MAG: histidine phosphatase family protein, partial [Mariprofundaceae bacterium]|nr:histidine phosphatase family protein [Mariprofundaceae bacterium]